VERRRAKKMEKVEFDMPNIYIYIYIYICMIMIYVASDSA